MSELFELSLCEVRDLIRSGNAGGARLHWTGTQESAGFAGVEYAAALACSGGGMLSLRTQLNWRAGRRCAQRRRMPARMREKGRKST